jgi:hypothetical protein
MEKLAISYKVAIAPSELGKQLRKYQNSCIGVNIKSNSIVVPIKLPKEHV